ncbi:MAG: ABC transporter permease [Candidatus Izemoplasmatales bacterium]|nr:ABC transporter permease [Candidatus Izemoplasmatales bacterium]
MIGYLIKRNLRIFFRDKASVFFSLLGVIIIIGLYVLFLGDMIQSGVSSIPAIGDSSRFMMDSWIMAGVVAAASITTCMGAFGIMIDDNVNHIIKDFKVAPIKNWQMVLGYIVSSILIGLVMSLITFVLAEVYIVVYGGELLSFIAIVKMLGLIILSVSSSSALVFFIVSLIKSQNAFGTASTILGTMIGFLTGIYIPIGSLPKAVQTVIKVFPVSHAAVLLRQTMMNEVVDLDLVPEIFLASLGVKFMVFDKAFPVWGHILVLVSSMLLFYGLAILVVSKKKATV